MKKSLLVAMLVTSSMALALASGAASAQGKSRDQVRQELVQAHHDGDVPSGKTQYPPSEQLVARNKEVHASAVHAGEKSPSIDQHDKR
ncbi:MULTISPECIES: DUF4148 domain-containing protein [unclassified Caballeronia]|uniref:DUF4148 domain-containing protein n=1 Tax=unclassified Caballeronia TaxID=2646786 RepID=UPI0028551775|nr:MULTISPECIES: DUF4148 domain-containing protein [unclassified Caballeronia]MDR5817090.1 DUF4148 domain-containing protein [Caballeronia sp. LZ033]MDR5823997.1 DUF4148 domain-containing protein [Caballeronia sp. LZ043]MDR5881893.1 DUF4148 domain-containing protein [Caballeronia sp. LZ032]